MALAVRASLIALVVNVGVGVPVYFWAGMSSYFMNDLPRADDNLNYLRWGIIAAILSSGVLVLLSIRKPGFSWRAVAFATGTSAAINGAWIAYGFGFNVANLADDSRTSYGAMTSSTLWSIVAGCVVAALLGLFGAAATAPRRT